MGSPTNIRGTATQKNATGFTDVAARIRNGMRGVKAINTSGRVSSVGVSAVPSIDTADSAAQPPRIHRVLIFHPARSSRSSPVGARRERTQRPAPARRAIGNVVGTVVVGTVAVCMLRWSRNRRHRTTKPASRSRAPVPHAR